MIGQGSEGEEPVDFAPGHGDVMRRGAAASADDAGPRPHEFGDGRTPRLRLLVEDCFTADQARLAGIGLRDDGAGGGRARLSG